LTVEWKEFTARRKMLEDEVFWNQRSKTWKWILKCKQVCDQEVEFGVIVVDKIYRTELG
jgi:hypothetical protein